jgi:multiple sugar transport system permease protein
MDTMLEPLRLEAGRPAHRQARRGGGTRRHWAWRALGYAALIASAAALLLPFYWMVVSSLKTNNDVYTVPIKWLPDTIVWQNYVDIWSKSDMTTWLKNTLILSVAVTALQVFTGSFAAYGFAKIRFPGRDVLFLAYIGTIAVPWQSYMVPQFILMSKLHLSTRCGRSSRCRPSARSACS